MPKRVRMVAEIIAEKCTGCRLCEQVCPTVAIGMRERLPTEAGEWRMIAILEPEACYNAQACVEICPHDAIEMIELEKPFDVAFDISSVNFDEVSALCRKSGYGPEMKICVCTTTTAGEIAAAVIGGANTMEKISLATGARTGCEELCIQPMLEILIAAGHGDSPRNPKNGFQWYGRSATLWQHLDADGNIPEAITQAYSNYPVNRERADIARLRKR